ncbi:MAG: flagellar hook-basal body complex protein [Thermodesulfobacteriota bacterium]|nr:flagellar hook-basal body complex protein [Thermodesulfobacteriota bacterium]
MSLSSSLFSGISGLRTLGNSMQIIGDNIANVNTIGFKGSSYSFQDLLAQATSTQSGTSQIGRGVALGDIYSGFEQGSFESTGNTTDLGIGGEGFFVVREPNSNQLFYSRAGNFRFDQDGYLVNPEGYVVQGWSLDDDGNNVGSVSDIQLSSFTSPPSETTQMTLINNLNADQTSNTSWLPNAWDASNASPIANSNYEYQTTVKGTDSLGSTHDITTYFDKVSGSDWEYLVTCNPSEDSRSFISGATDTSAGLLARGTVSFSDSSGTILPNGLTMETLTGTGHAQEISNYVFSGANGFTSSNTTLAVTDNEVLTTSGTGFQVDRDAAGNWTIAANAGYASAALIGFTDSGGGIDMDGNGSADITASFITDVTGAGTFDFDITGSANWTSETPNSNGYYEFNPDFIGGSGGSTVMDIEFDIGTQFDGTAWVNDSLTTTQFSRASTTTFQTADGYGSGEFEGVDVDVSGAISGNYSNGEILQLNRVALAKFLNKQELFKEGGNLYRQTNGSGDAITNSPGTNGLGDISPNSLEQSNVDVAEQFVKMITTQRGYQANSKIITTVDNMLSETINMKR